MHWRLHCVCHRSVQFVWFIFKQTCYHCSESGARKRKCLISDFSFTNSQLIGNAPLSLCNQNVKKKKIIIIIIITSLSCRLQNKQLKKVTCFMKTNIDTEHFGAFLKGRKISHRSCVYTNTSGKKNVPWNSLRRILLNLIIGQVARVVASIV